MSVAIAIAHPEPVSSMGRRKPLFTYQSPPSGSKILPKIHVTRTTRNTPPSHSPTTTTTTTTQTPATTVVTRRTELKLQPSRPKYLLDPPLPLYHPLGDFAKSLPELDAERLGLPVPARIRDREISVDDDKPTLENGKRSSRPRKPAAKLRDGEVEEEIQGNGDEAEGENETVNVQVKPTPKKRRGGGKRKRKDADDGDSAYPAKRPRHPRGTGQVAEEEGEVPDAMAVDGEERRTTRARANGSNRRDSSTDSGSKEKVSEHEPEDGVVNTPDDVN